jgi:hypothetical protein
MHRYTITFTRDAEVVKVTVVSPIDPASLILDVRVGYSFGDYEYVQECLTVLEDCARTEFGIEASYDFEHVTTPGGTVVQRT